MQTKFNSVKLFFIALMLSMGMANRANAQLQVDMDLPVNTTKGGLNLPASQGDILQYVIRTTNTAAANFVNSKFYNNIPAGTSYVTGSTSLNGYSIPDVNGKMPFVGGGYINSTSYGTGIIAPGTFAKVSYQIKVIANAGNISNSASADVTLNGVSYIQSSGTVVTPVAPDPACSAVYQSTPLTTSGTTYSTIRQMYPEYGGKGGTTIYNGASGLCYNAITGAALPSGSIMTTVAALAYDKNSNRIYFVNNVNSPAADLCYVDLSASPVTAKRFVGYPLETNTFNGYNINRMTFTADGYGYAVTSNALDLIRFSINASTGLPVISRLGPLENDFINGNNNIQTEAGGDIFSDGSGKLYMAVNSGKIYRINPATKIATYLGTINPAPSGATTAVAVDTAGKIYLGGSYQKVYKVDLNTLSSTSITSDTSLVWTTGDYTSCAFPILQPNIQVNKSYRNTNGNAKVASGDTIEYTIEVVNTGNINATGVDLYDAIPSNSSYEVASTKMNGITITDAAGSIEPFAVSGGRLINSPGELAGIIKPGDANKVVIKYWIVTAPLETICDQARVTLSDANGDAQTIYSDDPAQPGNQDATCFWSDSARTATPGARIATTGNTQLSAKGMVRVQPNPFVSALKLQLQLNTAATVQVRLFDLFGRTVFSTSQKLAAGFQSLHINVPTGLTPGIYVLDVTDGNNRLLQKKLLKK